MTNISANGEHRDAVVRHGNRVGAVRHGLTYAAFDRCPCGAGLAYRMGDDHWDCSAILDGSAIPRGHEGSVQHTDKLPFIFWEIKSEDQPSANGATTRP